MGAYLGQHLYQFQCCIHWKRSHLLRERTCSLEARVDSFLEGLAYPEKQTGAMKIHHPCKNDKKEKHEGMPIDLRTDVHESYHIWC